MSKIHVLEQTSNGKFRCVVHYDTPLGDNSVGESWVSIRATVNNLAGSVMPAGNGAGEIGNAENNSIIGGTVVEFEANGVPGGSCLETDQCFNDLIDPLITADKLAFELTYKVFGKVVS